MLHSFITTFMSLDMVRCTVVRIFSVNLFIVRIYFNPFHPRFLSWTLPSLNFAMSIIKNRGASTNPKRNGKQCRSGWDSSLGAVSSGSTLFAKESVLVCRDEMVKISFFATRSVYILLDNWMCRLNLNNVSIASDNKIFLQNKIASFL